MLVHHCFPFSHNLVYGLGKPLLEAGWLPGRMSRAASRYRLNGRSGGRLNPVNVGLWLFNRVDRWNDRLEEALTPPLPGAGERGAVAGERQISAMNICLKARVPG